MKKAILILTITFSVFCSQTIYAQYLKTINFTNAPENFSKGLFKKYLLANGISEKDFNSIGGMNRVINSLEKVSNQWQCKMAMYQMEYLQDKSEEKISIQKGQLTFAVADQDQVKELSKPAPVLEDQYLIVKNAPAKFYKSHLQRAIRSSGVDHAEYRKLIYVQNMINSLRFKDGKWRVKAGGALIKQLQEFSEGKIKIRNGQLEFADLSCGGTAE